MCELTARHGRGTAWARYWRGMGTACYVRIGLYTLQAVTNTGIKKGERNREINKQDTTERDR